jgi:hypothetical protein
MGRQIAITDAEHQKEMARIIALEQKELSELSRQMNVNQRTIEIETAYNQGQLEVRKLANHVLHLGTQAATDVEHYRNMKYAEYMKELLTPGYVSIEVAKNLLW